MKKPDFSPTERSRLRVLKKRGAYDRETIYGILDASLLCHVGYVVEGTPYVTPTAFWREGNHLYWHGSSASRALSVQGAGVPVCLTVAHIDGLVIARSGFHHSINYRSVMAFGTARLIDEPSIKARAMDAFVDRLFPGRAMSIRRPTKKELNATKLVGMDIEEATAKIRTGPPVDDDEDYALPIWAGVVDICTAIGSTRRDDRMSVEVQAPSHVEYYRQGAAFDAAISALASRGRSRDSSGESGPDGFVRDVDHAPEG